MFIAALLIGVYSYCIFFLGILGFLYREFVILLTVGFVLSVLVWYRVRIFREIRRIREIRKIVIEKNKLFLFFVFLLFVQALVNLIGAVGPELAFDALWYHLTLPKLYLINHSIYFIPGGLLYYSAMPKLAEMLYVVGLSFGNEITVKFIHFSFGLLTCIALYNLQRKFFNPLVSIIGVTIFYSNLAVAWESITAYVDLIRAFFEVMALWAFVNWWNTQRWTWLIWSAIMLGLAITVKLLALGSLVIFILLILLRGIREIRVIRKVGVFLIISLVVPSPWFIFSFINTGNPVYPFFTEIYKVAPEPLSVLGFVNQIWTLFTQAADPISPLYLIFSPLIVWLFMRNKIKEVGEIRIIGLFSLLSIVIWYFTPRTGGGRFILPYLPAFSILCSVVLFNILKNVRLKQVGNILILIIIFVSVISIGYRFVANYRYIPVILGHESKQEFLAKNLNFSFGDFYDTDNYFKNNIKSSDKVLLHGIHNLYYVDFPFVDATWLKPGDKYNYIATQKNPLSEEFKSWKLIYSNGKTMIRLYKKE